VVRSRTFLPKFLLALMVLALVVYLARSWWLAELGWALVHNESPAKADAILVLGGDDYGHRILKAAELARAGYSHVIVVSGPPGFYGAHECDLAIPFAVRHGYPSEWFLPAPNESHSTEEEAVFLLGFMRNRGAHSILVVTSNYHTRRSWNVYTTEERATGYAPAMRVVAAPDQFFTPDAWWRSREAKKTFFVEWMKTFAWKVGM
jgi:uncharacterized SAM-binding protein YcdF (DUF218 family)